MKPICLIPHLPAFLTAPAALFLAVLGLLWCPGFASGQAVTPLVEEGASAVAWVPTDGSVDATWNLVAEPANIGLWKAGTTGVGYERSTGYGPLIGLDVDAEMQAAGSQGCYVRIPFTVADAGALEGFRSLRLLMRYDDGFVAYINGTFVASANAPSSPDFQSVATGDNPDSAAVEAQFFDASVALPDLVVGTNVLAVHALNNGETSSDFLALPELEASEAEPPAVPDLRFVPVATGLVRPVGMAPTGDGSGRMFILEQRGTVRVFDGAALLPGNALDIQARVQSYDDGGGENERGLLGIAFPPGFPQVGKRYLYLYYTRSSTVSSEVGDSVLARFHLDEGAADPENTIDPASEEILLVIDQPFSNHNAGQINFGPDGMLWLALGDGGSGNDPGENAQNPVELLGKMLRLDVEGSPDPGLAYAIPPDNPHVGDPGVRDEIWARGLRNPWRWSFDRATGDLWIADVGQGAWEEVNFTPAGSQGGLNYGWDFYEAEELTTYFGTAVPPDFEDTEGPVFFYGRGLGTSITGGYVYRGDRFPRLYGKYWVADFNSGRIWMVAPAADGAFESLEVVDTAFRISCFGEDENGEIYLGDFGSSTVFRIEDVRDGEYLNVVASGFAAGTDQFTLEWGAEIGETYQVRRTTDLVTWEDVGAPVTATEQDGFRLSFTEDAGDAGGDRRYYQVVTVEP